MPVPALPYPEKPALSVVPDPAALQESAFLRKGISQLLDADRKNLEAMFAALARYLALLSPAEAADSLRVLNDEAVAGTLHHLSSSRRQEILGHFEAKRAKGVQRRLQNYAAR